ncbi:MAG: pullulanase [Candidatus Marinimicrobia bacterium]|nr:pullulanase [Candidatus Neomarinimicrobiota bacterium]
MKFKKGHVLLLTLITTATQFGFAISQGVTVKEGKTEFLIMAPASYRVELIVFENFADATGKSYEMIRKDGNHYSLAISSDLSGKYYGYRFYNYDKSTQEFPEKTIVADPYSRAVASQNIYNSVAKSLIYSDNFDWQQDTWVSYDPRDLIIYEAHLKDMTAHPSSGARYPGTYTGFVDKLQSGGIAHLKDMGYNAIEFLPLFDFGNVELPFRDSTTAIMNTWNPYERNHWGYMPSFYFAPESQFATDASSESGKWIGTKGRQISEFKAMVKALHDEEISVILDVVYNHTSQYDYQPLKQIDRTSFFRQNENGTYASVSGCGNDLNTNNEDMRKMLMESVLFWMTEYHIDGFRFDLGLLIDWQTIDLIKSKALELNPHVFITCEPWGGGYDPNGFSDHGWSSWNDQFRNGVKGQNPVDGKGFIFGEWQGDLYRDTFTRFVTGSLRENGGQYLSVEHSVNYLEAHDDFTLGDFIRIATDKVKEDEIISDVDQHAILNPIEIALHKLASLILFTSQGPVMVGEGQEWGRSKVIADTNVPDANIGKLDHNSYEKDNETNWLNWEHKEVNKNLVDHYRSLISLRNQYPALSRSGLNDIDFDLPKNKHALGYHLHPEGETALFVCVNGSNEKEATFLIPEGSWSILYPTNIPEIEDKLWKTRDKLVVPVTTGIILKLESK